MNRKNNKLSKEEVAYLFKHVAMEVDYFDVQNEIVDHLTKGIEAQWEQGADVTFKEALRKESDKFGVLGFKKIQDEKTALLKRGI
ncbi:hypothetical protein NBRC110019_19180 [Neptunitalea chrysea]|uniref:Uncharacterized protein n=1 Tax=Neptunitalea chrysea TaxID=1647581 RepID=A0A9W6B587_9FLAO|nr:hypothetical protein [Neptunitalea chrysea]GLB52878.1 hypothetical protein NBRC110019_19180 [Neptunitalea chrysea]